MELNIVTLLLKEHKSPDVIGSYLQRHTSLKPFIAVKTPKSP